MAQIKVISVDSDDELYCKFPSQHAPQPVYLIIRCEKGTLSCESSPNVGTGSMSADVYYGLTRTWSIPILNAVAANKLMAEVAPLAQRVIDGYEKVWDGHNHVGEVGGWGELRDDISVICESYRDNESEVKVWESSEWFGVLGGKTCVGRELGITSLTTDDQLSEISDREVKQAKQDDVLLVGSLVYLKEVRDFLKTL